MPPIRTDNHIHTGTSSRLDCSVGTMRPARTRYRCLAAVILVLLLVGSTACGQPGPAETAEPSEWSSYEAETTSYRIKLWIGPKVTLPMTRPEWTMTEEDGGRMANHHVEVHVFDRSTSSEVRKLVPAVSITDESTGETRQLAAKKHPSGEVPYMEACRLTNHRNTVPHFGDNLYLPDGTYTITVGVGDDTALFQDIVVATAG